MDLDIHFNISNQVIIALVPTITSIAWYITKRKKKDAPSSRKA
jgi:hypothetical protein